MNFERLYYALIGSSVPEKGYPIESCFDEEMERLYERCLAARMRISRTIDGNDDGENADALCIVESYEAMQKILCEKAFEYGVRYGRKEIEL